MKKAISTAVAVCMVLAIFAGCAAEQGFDKSKPITVVTREDGSGTRGAFAELFEIESEDENGNTFDLIKTGAITTNNTAVMMTTVGSDTYAIGYISLGSLNDTVKAVKIDGADASVENIKNGTYKISRPFNIATKSELSEAAQDFIAFILSADGQAIVEENGYIPLEGAGEYTAKNLSGKVTVAGSSSVTPVMEKLKEGYIAKNPNVQIDVHQSDSTTGMNSAIDGICDIGMASRAVKDSEKEKGLTETMIAMDGIAVIANNQSEVSELTSEQVRGIFTGEVTTWADVLGE